MQNLRVVLVTIPVAEAKGMARALVEQRLAACVNIIPRAESYFWWDHAVQTAEEAILLIKTTPSKLDQLIEHIRGAHSYELPEVIALPVSEGLPEYVSWILRETAARN